ncbi:MAG: alkaline phosphatase family protein [Bacillota bacterium]
MRIGMIFIDGFGLGEDKRDINPFVSANTPCLDFLLDGQKLLKRENSTMSSKALLVPLDANLGIPGIPQSATGQTTLWTGVNAAQVLGRHLRGFPNSRLKKILAEKGIFRQVLNLGKKGTFANAFSPPFFELQGIPISASTAATLGAGLQVRDFQQLLDGQAVYQDITHELLCPNYSYISRVAPQEAGERLAGIIASHDFALFEYFQTDVIGHQQDLMKATQTIEMLDAFIGAVINATDFQETTLVITSDHGNIEDLSNVDHTLNPVPAIIIGPGKELGANHLSGLQDVTPWMVDLLRV